MCVCARIEWIYVNYDAKWSFAVIKAVNIYETQSLNTSCFCVCERWVVHVCRYEPIIFNWSWTLRSLICRRTIFTLCYKYDMVVGCWHWMLFQCVALCQQVVWKESATSKTPSFFYFRMARVPYSYLWSCVKERLDT